MLLSEIQPWPVLSLLPGLTDAELHKVSLQNVRVEIERALRKKRVEPVYYELEAIAGEISTYVKETGDSMEHHLQVKRNRQIWQDLEHTVRSQMHWHLSKVVISADEVSALVTRWVLLRLDRLGDNGPVDVEGFAVVNGILKPKPGGARG